MHCPIISIALYELGPSSTFAAHTPPRPFTAVQGHKNPIPPVRISPSRILEEDPLYFLALVAPNPEYAIGRPLGFCCASHDLTLSTTILECATICALDRVCQLGFEPPFLEFAEDETNAEDAVPVGAPGWREALVLVVVVVGP